MRQNHKFYYDNLKSKILFDKHLKNISTKTLMIKKLIIEKLHSEKPMIIWLR